MASTSTDTDSEPIKSIAFFDIETTGLPDYDFNKTKITELCFVGCTKEQIFETKKYDMPRVLHKLSLCINPFKPISQGSTAISGLDNYMLEYDNIFSENVANMIINFLKHLQQPVCIVAHNGDKFDFPILMKELKRLKMELPSSVKCLDSLPIFRNIDDFQILQDENNLPEIKPIEVSGLPSTLSAIALETNETTINVELVESSSKIDWQKLNETTPTQQKIPANGHPMTRKRPAAKKELFPAVRTKAKKFTLVDVYEREFGNRPKQLHYAESDTLTLLKCVLSMKNEFFKYIDGHARNFSDVKPL